MNKKAIIDGVKWGTLTFLGSAVAAVALWATIDVMGLTWDGANDHPSVILEHFQK